MFGYVTAAPNELSDAEKKRYTAVYCGICRRIRSCANNYARLSLSYDMAFLALLHMSLYEPEETSGDRACKLHPFRPRPWVENPYIAYAADMNVALAYYNLMDDYEDDGSHSAKFLADRLAPALEGIRQRYPRQVEAMEVCIRRLQQLEQSGCTNPDEPAGCFGELMAELLVYEEDLWAPSLREMGMALGRFIYLTDAAVDYRRDKRKGKYNPLLAMGSGEDHKQWEQYLLMDMARCTDHFERLPLVQDKNLLDNILYSGVWTGFRQMEKRHGGEVKGR